MLLFEVWAKYMILDVRGLWLKKKLFGMAELSIMSWANRLFEKHFAETACRLQIFQENILHTFTTIEEY